MTRGPRRDGSKLGLQQRNSRRHLAQPLPAGGESGMQRQLCHVIYRDPAQLELSRLGTVSSSSAASAITVVYVQWAPVAPEISAVTTVVRTVNRSAGSPASSWASRTAACSAVSWLSRAPPGRPQVPPLVTPRRAVLQQHRGRAVWARRSQQ